MPSLLQKARKASPGLAKPSLSAISLAEIRSTDVLVVIVHSTRCHSVSGKELFDRVSRYEVSVPNSDITKLAISDQLTNTVDGKGHLVGNFSRCEQRW